MPCPPRGIAIGYYFLPATLGRAEQEEAAARIISFSHKLNQWVGVSWSKIVEMMGEDLEKEAVANEKLACHNEVMDIWFRQLYRYFWLCVLTLGIYGLFRQKPQRPGLAEKEKQKQDTPFSGIYLFGPGHVLGGIQELIGRKMLVHEKLPTNDDERMLDVFFPTPVLVARIMEVQGTTG
ncbi:MAG: hypothetical protein Q8O66_03210 [bacterium]|nr:hypothetical protein [bacterium]